MRDVGQFAQLRAGIVTRQTDYLTRFSLTQLGQVAQTRLVLSPSSRLFQRLRRA